MTSPCNRTAWPAGVVAGSPVCHPRTVWLCECNQPEIVGIAPAAIA